MARWVISTLLLVTLGALAVLGHSEEMWNRGMMSRVTVGPTSAIVKTVRGEMPANQMPVNTQVDEPQATNPLWSYEHPVAIYTSSLITNASLNIAAGVWLTPPYNLEVFNAKGSGSPMWTVTFDQDAPSWNDMIQVRVAVAKHSISAASRRGAAATVGTVVMVYDGPGNYTATLYGFAWASRTPVWSYALTKVATDLIDLAPLALSDDGSTLAVLVAGNLTFEHPPTIQLLVFNAQTGALRWTFNVPSGLAGIGNVQLSSDGRFALFMSETQLFVLDTVAKAVRGQPIKLDFTPAAYAVGMCPMGTWLAVGFETLYLYKWDASARAYAPQWTATNPNYYVASLAIADDMMAVGWNEDDTRAVTLSMYATGSSTPAWQMAFPPTQGQYQENLVKIAAVKGAFAVANWGAENDTSPTVLVFTPAAAKPIFTYTTPGSMFDIDLVRDGSDLVVVASGKLVHANEMGAGGQIVAFRVPLGTAVDPDDDWDDAEREDWALLQPSSELDV